MLGEMPLRRSSTNEYARESVQWFAWMRYAITAVTERDLPALQCTYAGDECSRASSVVRGEREEANEYGPISESYFQRLTEHLAHVPHAARDVVLLDRVAHRDADVPLEPLTQAQALVVIAFDREIEDSFDA